MVVGGVFRLWWLEKSWSSRTAAGVAIGSTELQGQQQQLLATAAVAACYLGGRRQSWQPAVLVEVARKWVAKG